MKKHIIASLALLHLLASAGCPSLKRDPSRAYAHAIYDPAEGDVPLPSDLVVEEGQLALPTDDPELTPADVAFREYLNSLEAWPTTISSAVKFSDPLAAESVIGDTVQVWHWGEAPERVEGVELTLEADGAEVSLTAPEGGWAPGGQYFALVRGGADGVRTAEGAEVGPDTAFYFLRLDEPLDSYVNHRAFPGATRAERLEVAATLEEIRLQLDPYLDFLEDAAPPKDRIPRDEVVALWAFSVTDRAELAMDADSGRMPLPFDLLIDPDTGLVDLPADADDSELEADAKLQANKLDGFGVSSDLMFELTGAADPATANTNSIQLWELGAEPRQLDISVRLLAEEGEAPCHQTPTHPDCRHVFVALDALEIPLAGKSTYALVVGRGLHDTEGRSVVPMAVGHFVASEFPLFADGRSQVAVLDDDDAERLEAVRLEVAPLLDTLDRDQLVAAWPFTTMDAVPAVAGAASMVQDLGIPVTPLIVARKPAYSLLGDDALEDLFPGPINPAPAIYAVRTYGVAEVVQGTLPMPYFLDRETRRWREDGSSDVEAVPFWAMVPEDVDPDQPLPVVIFGPAIVTDRRFLITISGRLATNGFAAVAIDYPFHGDRTVCIEASLAAVPNFFPEELQPLVGFEDELIWLPPCESGDDATCSDSGECLDATGAPEDFTTFPIIDMKPASGAAFLDVRDIPHITDHFRQALSDIGGLHHSLRTADWSPVFGAPVDPAHVNYVGQSLGSIVGSVYVAVTPDIEKVVLNVPGSNMVDLFLDSDFFGPQVDEYFREIEVEDGSLEQARLLAISSWLVDSVDPHTLGHKFAEDERVGLIQMDRIDEDTGDIIIPNYTTDSLVRVTGLPVIEYPSNLHVDLIVPGLGYEMQDDMVDFLTGELEL